MHLKNGWLGRSLDALGNLAVFAVLSTTHMPCLAQAALEQAGLFKVCPAHPPRRCVATEVCQQCLSLGHALLDRTDTSIATTTTFVMMSEYVCVQLCFSYCDRYSREPGRLDTATQEPALALPRGVRLRVWAMCFRLVCTCVCCYRRLALGEV